METFIPSQKKYVHEKETYAKQTTDNKACIQSYFSLRRQPEM